MIKTEPMEIRLKACDVDDLQHSGHQIMLFNMANGRSFTAGATEFYVIEDLAVSRHALSMRRGVLTEREYTIYLHPQINNTPVFNGIDYSSGGLSNRVIPYPKNGDDTISQFNIQPGQFFDIKILTETALKKVEYIYVYIRFTKYDSGDSVIACRLHEIGKQVTRESVDLFRDGEMKRQ